MPTLTITLSAAAATEVNDAFTSLYNYQTTINGEPNPETPGQFTRKKIMEFIKERVLTYRRAEALKTASVVDPDVT